MPYTERFLLQGTCPLYHFAIYKIKHVDGDVGVCSNAVTLEVLFLDYPIFNVISVFGIYFQSIYLTL